MLYYLAISGFFISICSFALGIFVLSKDPKNNVNRAFSYLCFTIAVWGFFYTFYPTEQVKEMTLLWFQLLHIGAVFTSVTNTHFAIAWLGKYKEKRNLLIFGYVTAALFVPIMFTPLFIKDMVPMMFFHFWAVPGILYPIYLLHFGGFWLYGLVLMFRSLKDLSGVKYLQTRIIVIALAVAVASGSTNYFLFYNIPIPPLANSLVLIYIIAVAYTILKYRLFNIKVIATQLLIFSIWIFLLVKVVLSESIKYRLIDGTLLVFVVIFGIFLIKSVLNEVNQREELEKASYKLKDLKDHLEDKIKEQTEEIKTAYIAERKARVELEELDKTKDQFILTTQHHLRTPLTILKGYLNVLQEKFSLPKEAKNTIEQMIKSTDTISKSINKLLHTAEVKAKDE